MRFDLKIILLGVVLIIAFVIGVFFGAVVGATVALAHHAPSGWEYDSNCCDNGDCDHLPKEAVTKEAAGFRVRLKAGDHKLIGRPVEFFIPYGAASIRPSGDNEFHLCPFLIRGDGPGGGYGTGNVDWAPRCFYVPSTGAV